MNKLKPEELYRNLSGFLKDKGIELSEGSYSHAVQKSCGVLTDIINLGSEGVSRAKTKLDTVLEQVRQTVHEKTAPKPPRITPEGTAKASAGESASTTQPGSKTKTAPSARAQKGGAKRAGGRTPRRSKSQLPKAKPVK
jgi:hypothetical protein